MDHSTLRNLLNDTKSSLGFETTNGRVPVACLKNAELPISFETKQVARDIVARGVLNLINLPNSVRPQLASAMFRACQQSFEECSYDFKTPQAQLDWEAEVTNNFFSAMAPSNPQDIWNLVKFSNIFVGKRIYGKFNGQYLVSIRGTTAWDGEHGIALFFSIKGEFLETGDLNR